MIAPIARSALTTEIFNHLVTTLADVGILVGRGIAPTAGGWAAGQPGAGAFTSYVTLKTGPATPGPAPEALARPLQTWRAVYSLTSTGVMEQHADDVADQVREQIVELPRSFVLRGVSWTLQQVEVPSLGGTSRNDSTNPPFWEVTDTVSLWLSRARTP